MNILQYNTYEELPALGTYGVAYVRELDAYYLYYPSLDSWEPLQSPLIEADRTTHAVATQGVNGYNLDYYPDYVSVRQKPYNINDLASVFGQAGIKDSTTITWHPGDLILRAQAWDLEILSQEVVPEGLLLSVNMPNGEEIVDKWLSSRSIPLQTESYDQFQIGTVLYEPATLTEHPVLEHWPNGRRARYEDPEPTGEGRLPGFWLYSNLPTRQILLRATAPIQPEAVALYNEATYMVTCECLDHGPLATGETGEANLGHRRKCFQCIRLKGGLEPRVRRYLTDDPTVNGDITYVRDDITGTPQWRYLLDDLDPLLPQLYTCWARADLGVAALPHGYLFSYTEQPYTLPTLSVRADGEIVRSTWGVPLYAGRLYLCGPDEGEEE
jgi:hypothetical protein